MKITCFGEVLWDVFPTHKKIGGAPLNVALRLQSMNVDSGIISRVGNDSLGEEIKSYLASNGLSAEMIQEDKLYKTGEVTVSLDAEGTASYEINKPVAWDFIESTDFVIHEVTNSDAFIFGSLASRNEVSKKTLLALLEAANFKVLDVNLRPPHYTGALLLDLMEKADFIKCNDEELDEICDVFEIQQLNFEEKIKALASHTQTDQICVIKGGKGATLFFKNQFYHNAGYTIKVVDTVGAGDSFLATLLSKLLHGEEPQKSLDYGCAVGALVAGSEGANPLFTDQEIEAFIRRSI